MIRALYIILICFLLFGCNATKRATKKLAKIKANHPELFETTEKRDTVVRVDTVQVITDSTTIDTIILRSDSLVFDTLRSNRGRAATTVFIEKIDTLVRYRINTVVQPDTIELIKQDTLIRTEIKETIATEYKEGIPWYAWLLVAASFAAGVLIMNRRRN